MSNPVWKTDDNKWMRERKMKWKEVQLRLKDFSFIDKRFHAAIKRYFLTGEIGEGADSLNKFEAAPLIEFWLHPDDSVENLMKIRDSSEDWKFASSKRFFESIIWNLGTFVLKGKTESFFDGREESLYDIFFNRELKREDYLDLDDEEFKKEAWNIYQGTSCKIVDALLGDVLNPYNGVNYSLDAWCDAIRIAYDPNRVEFDWVVQLMDRVHRNPEQFSPEQVKLVKHVADILSDPTLPESVKVDIQSFRARPCHPDCASFIEKETESILCFISGDINVLERVNTYLNRETRPEFEDEVPVEESALFEAMEYIESPENIKKVSKNCLYARYKFIDEDTIFDIFRAFDHLDLSIGRYAYFADDEEYKVYYRYDEGKLERVYMIEDDEAIDERLWDMDWDEKALQWIVENLTETV